MNIIKAARSAMDMTQQQFADWLSGQVGHVVRQQRVAEWESGTRSPRKNIREICLPVVAGEIASDAVLQACTLFRQAGVAPLIIAMSPEMQTVKDNIKNRIIRETA